MNIKQFAALAGMEIIRCEKEKWGGKFGYRTKDLPGCEAYGYRTEAETYNAWMRDSFGNHFIKAIKKLLKDSEK